MPASPHKHQIRYLAGRALKAGGRLLRKSRLKKKWLKAQHKVLALIPKADPSKQRALAEAWG